MVNAMNKTKRTIMQLGSALLILVLLLVSLTGCGNDGEKIQEVKGKPLDLTGFTVTFEDQFEGNEIDETKWTTDQSWLNGDTPVRRGGFWDEDQVFVENGNLIIRIEYKEKGKHGSGYYTGVVNTKDLFEQAGGYFEVRCKVPATSGAWAAFWMLNEGMSTVGNGGIDGSEMDIFESQGYYLGGDDKNSVSHAVHYNGYDENTIQSKGSGQFKVDDPYNEFHTYGMLWDENSYTFYIDGVKSWKFKKPGVSLKPEFLILSCEVLGKDSLPEDGWCGDVRKTPAGNFPADFVVDYVRVYQSPETTLSPNNN